MPSTTFPVMEIQALQGGRVFGVIEASSSHLPETVYGLYIEMPNGRDKIVWILKDSLTQMPGHAIVEHVDKNILKLQYKIGDP